MSCSIDLGQRDFSSSVSDLKLSLHAFASILLSPESPFLHDSESEHLKEALCSGDIWVFQASEVKFEILISSSSDLHLSLAHLIPQLGESICKAKMWSDLGLDVLYRSCILEQEQPSSTYSLSFGIQKRIGPPEKTKAARLPKILRNVGEAIPPNDIATARITSIGVRLEYKHNHRHCITGIAQTKLQHQRDGTIQSPESSDCDRMAYLPKRISTTAEISEFTLDEYIMGANEELEPANQPLPESFGSSEFGTLFRDGLRTLVWGDVRRRGQRKQTETEGFRSLSSIAPSVFKPGYREAMNQRARLMPSIAKSLTSLLKLSDNQALKDRVASVIVAPDSFSSSPTLMTEDHTKAMLKTRLWSIAQKRLHHAPTPKQLKPSNTFLDPEQNEQLRDEILLSETPTFDEENEALQYEFGLHSDSDALAFLSDFEEIGGSNSVMILENSSTEHNSEQDLDYDQDLLDTGFAEEPHRSQTSFSHCFYQNTLAVVDNEYEMLCDDI
ncbi:hypothetical protein BDV12DRAFT_192651 [Aspergillus spectabilis]